MTDTSSETQRQFVCRRCRHYWTGDDAPELCPRCHSCRWMQGRTDRIFCPYCAHLWYPRERDEVCPSCGMHPSLKGKERLTCVRCEYIWVKEENQEIPERCPLCRTSAWSRESAFTHVCSMCGHIWRNKVEEPLRCPSCYSEIWNVPAHRLQCKRCGHRWVSRSKLKGVAAICPKCKSIYWREPPPLQMCAVCGRPFTSGRARSERCQVCTGKEVSFDHVCNLCGQVWSSEKKYCSCPKCGSSIDVPEVKSESVLWSEGDRSLLLQTDNGSSVIYLRVDDIPLTSVYLPDAMNLLGKTQKELFDTAVPAEYRRLAETMYLRRNDYLEKVPFLEELLDLDRGDAEILAMHFDSMGPEAIALRLGIQSSEVSDAFARIMTAYQTTGITVNDSVYTADPFAEYWRQLGE